MRERSNVPLAARGALAHIIGRMSGSRACRSTKLATKQDSRSRLDRCVPMTSLDLIGSLSSARDLSDYRRKTALAQSKATFRDNISQSHCNHGLVVALEFGKH